MHKRQTVVNNHGTPVKIFVFKARVYHLSVTFVLLIIISNHSFVISLVASESDFKVRIEGVEISYSS